MDLWFSLQLLHGTFAFGALLLAIPTFIFLRRLRGVVNWQHSLRKQLKGINNEIKISGETRGQALRIVMDHCQRAWRTNAPELKELADLFDYIRSIALCYHPHSEKPEMRITVGRFLLTARDFVRQLELILRRTGFQRLQRVRIRHIRKFYEWHNRLNNYRIIKFFCRNRKIISRLSKLRLVILPDPFVWIAYLSNRLTILTLTRCLLVDVYLFTGKLAIQVYEEGENEEPVFTKIDELEKTLEDLYSLNPSEPHMTDPRIIEIRNRLVAFTSIVISTPKLEDWKEAVRQMANVIAKKHFPDSEHPLEEAALGPLLTRSQAWIKSICETEKIPVVKKFYRIKIESLYHMKSITDDLLPEHLKTFAKRAWGTYRWMKWPLKIYRVIKKGSPVGIAMDVGWVVAKKSFVNFICRLGFDIAHKELEMIYSQSAVGKHQ